MQPVFSYFYSHFIRRGLMFSQLFLPALWSTFSSKCIEYSRKVAKIWTKCKLQSGDCDHDCLSSAQGTGEFRAAWAVNTLCHPSLGSNNNMKALIGSLGTFSWNLPGVEPRQRSKHLLILHSSNGNKSLEHKREFRSVLGATLGSPWRRVLCLSLEPGTECW